MGSPAIHREGFRWEWSAFHRVGLSVVPTLLALLRFTPETTLRDLTLREMEGRWCEAEDTSIGFGEFRGWTFVRGLGLFWERDLTGAATALGTDGCTASCVSASWALGFQYARPDGTFRHRLFSVEETRTPTGDTYYVKLTYRGTKGEELGWDLLPFKLVGPGGTILPPDDRGKEETRGVPLSGEPTNLLIADERRLLAVLTGIGVPLETLLKETSRVFTLHRGRFDQIPKPD